jgi:HSP20 family protein
MEAIFQQLNGGLGRGFGPGTFFSSMSSGNWLPAVDVTETATSYVVEADLPGVQKGEMNVTIDKNRLCISGNRPYPKRAELFPGSSGNASNAGEVDRTPFGFVERRFGKFERCFQLQHRVLEDSVQARMQNGVLEVTLQKETPSSGSPSRINID